MRLLRFTKNLMPHYAIVAVFSVAVALAPVTAALASVVMVSSSVAVALSGIAGAFVIGKVADTVVHTARLGREGEEAFVQV